MSKGPHRTLRGVKHTLSKSEIELLELIDANPNATSFDLANTLGLAYSTVQGRLQSIYEVLKITGNKWDKKQRALARWKETP